MFHTAYRIINNGNIFFCRGFVRFLPNLFLVIRGLIIDLIHIFGVLRIGLFIVREADQVFLVLIEDIHARVNVVRSGDTKGTCNDAPDFFFPAIGNVDAGVNVVRIGDAEGVADDVSDFARLRVDEGVPVRVGFRCRCLPGDSEWRRDRLPKLLRGDGSRFEDCEGSEQDRESDPPQLRQVFRNQVHGTNRLSWSMCAQIDVGK